MATMKRCPHCHVPYSRKVRVGSPFQKCKSCNRDIVDTDTNEWELQGGFDKIIHVISWCWKALLYGLALPVAVYIITRLFLFDFLVESNINMGVVYGVSWVIGVAIVTPILIRGNIKNVRDSKERMKAPEYRAQLRSAGLLKS